VNEIDAAFTPSAGAIAESGSIILSDESTPDRLAALAPWHHIALVSRAEIHRTIADALAAMPADPNLIWVTGPSKTADVEGILIQGVHGPGAQACLIL
jgi:L-lactate dehydrogenase complex protein LldG